MKPTSLNVTEPINALVITDENKKELDVTNAKESELQIMPEYTLEEFLKYTGLKL